MKKKAALEKYLNYWKV